MINIDIFVLWDASSKDGHSEFRSFVPWIHPLISALSFKLNFDNLFVIYTYISLSFMSLHPMKELRVLSFLLCKFKHMILEKVLILVIFFYPLVLIIEELFVFLKLLLENFITFFLIILLTTRFLRKLLNFPILSLLASNLDLSMQKLIMNFLKHSVWFPFLGSLSVYFVWIIYVYLRYLIQTIFVRSVFLIRHPLTFKNFLIL